MAKLKKEKYIDGNKALKISGFRVFIISRPKQQRWKNTATQQVCNERLMFAFAAKCLEQMWCCSTWGERVCGGEDIAIPCL